MLPAWQPPGWARPYSSIWKKPWPASFTHLAQNIPHVLHRVTQIHTSSKTPAGSVLQDGSNVALGQTAICHEELEPVILHETGQVMATAG
jgi:hypothetical protein